MDEKNKGMPRKNENQDLNPKQGAGSEREDSGRKGQGDIDVNRRPPDDLGHQSPRGE